MRPFSNPLIHYDVPDGGQIESPALSIETSPLVETILVSAPNILDPVKLTEWPGFSWWMWRETLELTELGLLCSSNLALKDLSLSPM